MQSEVFLTSVTVHLMTHCLKDFRITSNWPDGEELHYEIPTINEDNPTNKQVVSFCIMRRIVSATNKAEDSTEGHAFEVDAVSVLPKGFSEIVGQTRKDHGHTS